MATLGEIVAAEEAAKQKAVEQRAACFKLFVSRVQVQGIKGKKLEEATVSFVVGAASYAAAAFGEQSVQWSIMSLAAFLISTAKSPYAELVKFSEGK